MYFISHHVGRFFIFGSPSISGAVIVRWFQVEKAWSLRYKVRFPTLWLAGNLWVDTLAPCSSQFFISYLRNDFSIHWWSLFEPILLGLDYLLAVFENVVLVSQDTNLLLDLANVSHVFFPSVYLFVWDVLCPGTVLSSK